MTMREHKKFSSLAPHSKSNHGQFGEAFGAQPRPCGKLIVTLDFVWPSAWQTLKNYYDIGVDRLSTFQKPVKDRQGVRAEATRKAQ